MREAAHLLVQKLGGALNPDADRGKHADAAVLELGGAVPAVLEMR